MIWAVVVAVVAAGLASAVWLYRRAPVVTLPNETQPERVGSHRPGMVPGTFAQAEQIERTMRIDWRAVQAYVRETQAPERKDG